MLLEDKLRTAGYIILIFSWRRAGWALTSEEVPALGEQSPFAH